MTPDSTAIDWPQRSQLAATIRRFLNSELTAFEFDEALDHYRESPDPIVQFAHTHFVPTPIHPSAFILPPRAGKNVMSDGRVD